ncbi:xanthine dehydrogenase family protein molybdopterin-binding subunit [Foetidibacter luteolus]|uniref:xanthine dehydrogenase family protein molybdopterin-binding subunit n=1 Tax=Foetidibacter luteolus TaxID=2608880 RepID=UPI00129C01F3|nr:molybdopterin cofactor-binding domain-containing protein [Foetidibacter luteolus]
MQPTGTTALHQYSRRLFLKNTGCLVIGFTLLHTPGKASCTIYEEQLAPANTADAWIRIDEDGTISVLTGKTELGQGVRTALMQMAAEELDVDMKRMNIVIADTGLTPDERYTAGSASIESSGRSIRLAAAAARLHLLKQAASQLNVPVDRLQVTDGTISADGNGAAVTYWQLLKGKKLELDVDEKVAVKPPSAYTIVGKPLPRKDITAMATAQPFYLQDMRMPGMLHARILRPPSYNARLLSLPAAGTLQGITKLVRNGNFVAVIAQEEYDAVRALDKLRKETTWEMPDILPFQNNLMDDMLKSNGEVETVVADPAAETALGSAAIQHEALYTKPYVIHGSIGPSCALALFENGNLRVWSHTQGVYPLRATLSNLTGLAEDKIRITAVPGSGCYGHNGADDAGADAALLAMEMPGTPVKLQWMREDEHRWEPYGTAMALKLKGGVTKDGKISGIVTEIWSGTHSTRPGGKAGYFLAGRHLEKPFSFVPGKFSGGSYRNAVPLYNTPKKVLLHNYTGPLRTSALRSLGAYGNIFALESFIDELAAKAGIDPLSFRLQNLIDERAIAVLKAVTDKTGWQQYRHSKTNALGLAFAQYKNEASYFAVVAEVAINSDGGSIHVKKLTGAIDAGQVINPDGVINQTEGGMIQSASWTLMEQVKYGPKQIETNSWETYPILRFPEVPETEVIVLDHPELEPLGAGEAAQGPVSAAIANAVFRATGKRLRNLPLQPV